MFEDVEPELQSTRRVLERVPTEHFGWRPHERSFTLGELSTHVVNLMFWMVSIIERDELDLDTLPPRPPVPDDSADLLKRFDESAAAALNSLESAAPSGFERTWTLRRGDHLILARPKGAVLRSMGIHHLIHHRGQMTVYLRLLDVAVPGMYGPSADETS